MPNSIKLVVGLGNPGKQYEQTRHNAGYWLLDLLAQQHQLTFQKQEKFRAQICRLHNVDFDCWFCKPLTFMNESGFAVQAISNFYQIPLQQTLVLHDEIDLSPGEIRLKQNGGHGGHNGLRHIIQQCGGKDFYRLRIGVGHPGHKSKVAGYVLKDTPLQDKQVIDTAIERGQDNFNDILSGKFQQVMQTLHTQ